MRRGKQAILRHDSIEGLNKWWRYRAWMLSVLILVLIGGGYRTYHLGKMSYWMDEAFSVQTARAIQHNGIPRLESGEVVTSWLPAHYIMAGSMSVFSEMHQAARLPSAVAGTIVILLTGMAAYLMVGSRLSGVCSAFLAAFSVLDIAWSRQARGYALLEMFGMAAVVYALLDLKSHNNRRWLLIAILLALAICTHRAGYIYWLICTGILILNIIAPRQAHSLQPDGMSRAILVIYILMPILLGAILPHGVTQGLVNTIHSLSYHDNRCSYVTYYAKLIYNIWRLNVLWMLVGAVLMVVNDWRKTFPVILANVAYLYVLSCRNSCFNVRYLVPISPFLHLMIGSAIGLITAWILKKSYPVVCKTILIAFVFISWGITSQTQNLNYIFGDEYELGPTEPQANWKEAMSWVKKDNAVPVTIMALPVFHDIYLGSHTGTKKFLPFTYSRIPGDWQ